MIELTTSDGKKYKLGFTRNSIKQMEANGFNFSEYQNRPLTTTMELIEGAFRTYNPKMSEEKIYEIYSQMENKTEFLAALTQMVEEPLKILMSPESDGDKGKNVSWKVI